MTHLPCPRPPLWYPRILLAGVLALMCACQTSALSQSAHPSDRSPAREVRALWVTRWDYRSPEDVRRILANAAWAGFNRVYFQVRGAGTCFYPSKIEAWTWELHGDVAMTGKDPGWDPLALAIAEAHRLGMQLHAYLNVLPGWKNETSPPPSSRQLYVAHPEWFMVDKRGRRMSPVRHKFYAFLNPARADVRAYLADLFSELTRNYPALDGIHLDYIRYPGEIGDFSHDAESLAQFRIQSKGKTPAQAPALWDAWRSRQVNLLLAEIARAIRQHNPGLEISAAVVANYREAASAKAQRSLEWPVKGLVDTLVPMAYHYDQAKYGEYLETFLGRTRPAAGKVVIGIWPAAKWRVRGYNHQRMAEQIQAARRRGADGIAVFAYSRFFPGHKPNSWARYLREHCFASQGR